jgi:hypothetical protein
MSLPTTLAELVELVDFNQQSLFGMLHQKWTWLPNPG